MNTTTIISMGAILTLSMAALLTPLPPVFLDALISLNWALSVSLLLVVWAARQSIQLEQVPRWLMTLTIGRLCVNIATTRSILSIQSGGGIIDRVGDLLLGSRWVVGLVFFIALICIQYLVIARGVERIAQLTSRFTLEALPGAQNAIMLSLERKQLHVEEARRRQASLHRQATRAGSMEGVLKFLKGEQLAAMILTIINALGGASVGFLHAGSSLPDALISYGRLTIGDAVLSQAPALYCSLASTLYVTRLVGEVRSPQATDQHDTLNQLYSASLLGGAVGLICVAVIPLWEMSSQLMMMFVALFIICAVLCLRQLKIKRVNTDRLQLLIKGHPILLRQLGGSKEIIQALHQSRQHYGLPPRRIRLEEDPSLLSTELLLIFPSGSQYTCTLPSDRLFYPGLGPTGIHGFHPLRKSKGVWRTLDDAPPLLCELSPLEWMTKWVLSHWRRDGHFSWRPHEAWSFYKGGDQALCGEALPLLSLIEMTNLLRQLTAEGCLMTQPDALLEGMSRSHHLTSQRTDPHSAVLPSEEKTNQLDLLYASVRKEMELKALIGAQRIDRLGFIWVELPTVSDLNVISNPEEHYLLIDELMILFDQVGHHEGPIAILTPRQRRALQLILINASIDVPVLSPDELPVGLPYHSLTHYQFKLSQ